MRVEVPISWRVSALPVRHRNRKYGEDHGRVHVEIAEAPADATVVTVHPASGGRPERFLRVDGRLYACPVPIEGGEPEKSPLEPDHDWTPEPTRRSSPYERESPGRMGGLARGTPDGREGFVARHGSIKSFKDEGYETTARAVQLAADRCLVHEGEIWGLPVQAGLLVSVDHDARVRLEATFRSDYGAHVAMTHDMEFWFDPSRVDDAKRTGGELAGILSAEFTDTVGAVEGADGPPDPVLSSGTVLSAVSMVMTRTDYFETADPTFVASVQETRAGLAEGRIGPSEAITTIAEAADARDVPDVVQAVVAIGRREAGMDYPAPAGALATGHVRASTDLQVSRAAGRHMLTPEDERALRSDLSEGRAVLVEALDRWFVCDERGPRPLSSDPSVEAFRGVDHKGSVVASALAALDEGGVGPAPRAEASPFLDVL